MRANLAITAHERLTTHTLPSSGPPGRLPPRGKAFVKGTALRTKRTLLNMAYALGSSLLLLLLGLVTRRLLVDNFGPQITTASQVVSQLFNFFSIAEFGVGSVISYRLYEQIAAKNEEKISKYMSMYKWAYRVVGLVIAGLALIGAAAMALAFGLFVWLPNQQFSYVIWWDSVADDPDCNKIVYRLNGEEKSLWLLLDPEDHGRVIGCAEEPGMAEAMDAAELLNEPGSLDTLSERANQAIEAMGGTVLRHELWLAAASREDDDPLNDDMPYSVCFYADSDDQDIPWL